MHISALQKQLVLLTLGFILKAPLIYQSPKSKRNFTALFLLYCQDYLKLKSHQSAIPAVLLQQVFPICLQTGSPRRRDDGMSVCLACMWYMVRAHYTLAKWTEGSISIPPIPTIPPYFRSLLTMTTGFTVSTSLSFSKPSPSRLRLIILKSSSHLSLDMCCANLHWFPVSTANLLDKSQVHQHMVLFTLAQDLHIHSLPQPNQSTYCSPKLFCTFLLATTSFPPLDLHLSKSKPFSRSGSNPIPLLKVC